MNAVLCGIHHKKNYWFHLMTMISIHWTEGRKLDCWWFLNFILTSCLPFYCGGWLGLRPVKSYVDDLQLIRPEGQGSERKWAESNLRGPVSFAPAQAQMSFLIQSATLTPGGISKTVSTEQSKSGMPQHNARMPRLKAAPRHHLRRISCFVHGNCIIATCF